jgi:hypothetical protein
MVEMNDVNGKNRMWPGVIVIALFLQVQIQRFAILFFAFFLITYRFPTIKITQHTRLPPRQQRAFIMTKLILKAAVVILTAFTYNVNANTAGVGSCDPGDTSIRNTNPSNFHGSSSQSLIAAGVTFSVGGTALTASTATTFPAGTDLEWSVDASVASFKGIFVRVEAAGDFTHTGDPSFVDEASPCAAYPGVKGVDHFDGSAKTSVTGTTNFNSAGAVTVDIVIVFTLTQWAYAQYLLTIEQVAAPTDAPVAAPTETPVAAPTETPVAAPTETPVAAPTETPVETPVEIPTVPPVETPVDVPVDTPVEDPTPGPVAVPVFIPTATPVDITGPSKAPIVVKGMGMKMDGKTKKGMDTKGGDDKESKQNKKGENKSKQDKNDEKESKQDKKGEKESMKDKKGMKERHNLRY